MERLSVSELIAELKKCPDQDAFVIVGELPEADGRDMTMIDGVKARPGRAVVELILGGEGYW